MIALPNSSVMFVCLILHSIPIQVSVFCAVLNKLEEQHLIFQQVIKFSWLNTEFDNFGFGSELAISEERSLICNVSLISEPSQMLNYFLHRFFMLHSVLFPDYQHCSVLCFAFQHFLHFPLHLFNLYFLQADQLWSANLHHTLIWPHSISCCPSFHRYSLCCFHHPSPIF